MLKKILVGLALALVALGLYANFGKQPTPIDHNTYSYQMLQPGPYTVASEDVELVDDSRQTQASGDFAGADSRTLLTRIWWPENGDQPGPLVIYSHGFMSSREEAQYLAEYLASHGYVVAAADYPLSGYNAPGPQLAEDVVNQPGDVSFILDDLLHRNEAGDDSLHNRIDPQRIAAVGLSLGGMTTELVAYHPDTSDPRIAAAVSIAGPTFMFSRQFFQHRRLPFMMLASPIDAMVEYQANARPVLENIDGALLVTMADASHAGFSAQATALRFLDNADSIGCWMIEGKIDTETSEDEWYDLIGSPEQGVLHEAGPPLCGMDPLPPAINPIRQHWLTTLAVGSFLQSLFQESADERDRYRNYLLQQLAHENPEMKVEGAAVSQAPAKPRYPH